jgi:hypothetical protein
MKKTQFHTHNAYTMSNANHTIFYSYETPVLIVANLTGGAVKCGQWFSTSTTRQLNRYIKENNLNPDTQNDPAIFRALMSGVFDLYPEMPRHLGLLNR